LIILFVHFTFISSKKSPHNHGEETVRGLSVSDGNHWYVVMITVTPLLEKVLQYANCTNHKEM
ncbi:TPA: hypothetical protein ACQVLQ_005387, partial [Serratia marcescens]